MERKREREREREKVRVKASNFLFMTAIRVAMAEDREVMYFHEGHLDFPTAMAGKSPGSPALIKGISLFLCLFSLFSFSLFLTLLLHVIPLTFSFFSFQGGTIEKIVDSLTEKGSGIGE